MPHWFEPVKLQSETEPTGEQILGAAILRQALLDAQTGRGLVRIRARAWLTRGGSGFAFWCTVCSLDAAKVHALMLGLLDEAANGNGTDAEHAADRGAEDVSAAEG